MKKPLHSSTGSSSNLHNEYILFSTFAEPNLVFKYQILYKLETEFTKHFSGTTVSEWCRSDMRKDTWPRPYAAEHNLLLCPCLILHARNTWMRRYCTKKMRGSFSGASGAG